MTAQPKLWFDGAEPCELLPVSETRGFCIKPRDESSVALAI